MRTRDDPGAIRPGVSFFETGSLSTRVSARSFSGRSGQSGRRHSALWPEPLREITGIQHRCKRDQVCLNHSAVAEEGVGHRDSVPVPDRSGRIRSILAGNSTPFRENRADISRSALGRHEDARLRGLGTHRCPWDRAGPGKLGHPARVAFRAGRGGPRTARVIWNVRLGFDQCAVLREESAV